MKRKRYLTVKLGIIALWLILLLSMHGCSSSSDEANPGNDGDLDNDQTTTCSKDLDCPGGTFCDLLLGECVSAVLRCTTDADCGEGYVCSSNLTCTQTTNPLPECGEDQVLIDGNCETPECREDSDCEEGELCDTETYLCETEPPPEGGCNTDDDCSDPQVCIDNVCDYCSKDEDCPPDKECITSSQEVPSCQEFNCRNDEDCREDWWCKRSSNRCMPPCTEHEECDAGYLCEEGVCVEIIPECENDWDCEDKKLCNAYQLCERGDTCSTDAQCSAERRCGLVEHYCVPDGCFKDADCDGTKLCDFGTHECRYAVPTGQPCGYDDQCLSTDICHASYCRTLCDPYEADCTADTVCAILTDAASGRGSVCLPELDGQENQDYCGEATPCRADLICYGFTCQEVCNPEAISSTCGEGLACVYSESWGLGICQPQGCDDVSNPCSDGQICYAGTCVTCLINDHCPSRHYCQDGQCHQGCEITSCSGENEYCNSSTHRCEELCIPACTSGNTCVDGSCVPTTCDPPCTLPATCENGVCVEPPDCRTEGCVDERWICDQDTGYCYEPECPPCESWQCCSELTDYQCSNICYTCSALDPTGTCPEGRICEEGICRDIPCVQEQAACGAAADPQGAPCCEGTICCEAFPGSGGICCTECDIDGTCKD